MTKTNKTIKTECAYCNQTAQCVKWAETGEMVCFNCRLGLLEEEFEAEDYVRTFDYENY